MSVSKLTPLWEAYLQELNKNPIQTKALTAGALSVVSDVLAQVLTGAKLSTLDLKSLRNQFLIGLIFRGPIVHYWYTLLEWIFQRLGLGDKRSANSTQVVIGKVALDQLTFSPIYNLAYFYIIGAFNGLSQQTIKEKIAREYVPIMMTNYKVWPLVNFINFKFVPPNLRVLFGNVVAIFWMTYIIQMTKGK